jgi:hypothetical protein
MIVVVHLRERCLKSRQLYCEQHGLHTADEPADESDSSNTWKSETATVNKKMAHIDLQNAYMHSTYTNTSIHRHTQASLFSLLMRHMFHDDLRVIALAKRGYSSELHHVRRLRVGRIRCRCRNWSLNQVIAVFRGVHDDVQL